MTQIRHIIPIAKKNLKIAKKKKDIRKMPEQKPEQQKETSQLGEKVINLLKKWFYFKTAEKKPDMRKLIMDIIYFIVSLLITLIIYNKILILNEVVIVSVKFGSILLIIATMFTLMFFIGSLKYLKMLFAILGDGVKIILGILLLLAVIQFYINQDIYVTNIKNTADSIELYHFNPLYSEEDKARSESEVLLMDIKSKPEMSVCKENTDKLIFDYRTQAKISFSADIINYKKFDNKAGAENFAAQYETASNYPICKRNNTENYIALVYHLRFEDPITDPNTQVILSEKDNIYFCDQEGQVLETSYTCR
ncbi:hypothetical protein ACFL0W_01390 [Nanoarchaeota archaeon]